MPYMVVTLEVSKPSGWLNADAPENTGVEAQRLVERRRLLPRVERRAYGARRGGEPRARRWEIARFGAGHAEERTPNMFCMFVTLEVPKLSGWLNALALCRGVEKRAYV
eukprot:scaffold9984_cov65-Phaeocystis_antarctica.AAC.1